MVFVPASTSSLSLPPQLATCSSLYLFRINREAGAVRIALWAHRINDHVQYICIQNIDKHEALLSIHLAKGTKSDQTGSRARFREELK